MEDHRYSELAIVNALGREFDRAAAPRRPALAVWPRGRRSLAVAVAGLTLSVAAAGAATGFLPVGSVISDGEHFLPEEGDHVVVVTGEAPVSGPWQLEAYTSGRLTVNGKEYQAPGHPSLDLRLTDPPEDLIEQGAGGGNVFPGTPGFSRHELPVSGPDGPVELLIYGSVPESAESVRLTGAGGFERRVEPQQGPPSSPGKYWVIAAPASLDGGRVSWLDSDGQVGGTLDVLYSPSRG